MHYALDTYYPVQWVSNFCIHMPINPDIVSTLKVYAVPARMLPWQTQQQYHSQIQSINCLVPNLSPGFGEMRSQRNTSLITLSWESPVYCQLFATSRTRTHPFRAYRFHPISPCWFPITPMQNESAIVHCFYGNLINKCILFQQNIILLQYIKI